MVRSDDDVQIERVGQYVYAMTNEAMPGLVKIGVTTDSVEARRQALSRSTAVPAPFEVLCYAKVRKAYDVEALLHRTLAHCRLPGKEFFRVETACVIAAFGLLAERAFVFNGSGVDYDPKDVKIATLPEDIAPAPNIIGFIEAFRTTHGRMPQIPELRAQFSGLPKTTAWRRLEEYRNRKPSSASGAPTTGVVALAKIEKAPHPFGPGPSDESTRSLSAKQLSSAGAETPPAPLESWGSDHAVGETP